MHRRESKQDEKKFQSSGTEVKEKKEANEQDDEVSSNDTPIKTPMRASHFSSQGIKLDEERKRVSGVRAHFNAGIPFYRRGLGNIGYKILMLIGLLCALDELHTKLRNTGGSPSAIIFAIIPTFILAFVYLARTRPAEVGDEDNRITTEVLDSLQEELKIQEPIVHTTRVSDIELKLIEAESDISLEGDALNNQKEESKAQKTAFLMAKRDKFSDPFLFFNELASNKQGNGQYELCSEIFDLAGFNDFIPDTPRLK